jgi:hypothetical protein
MRRLRPSATSCIAILLACVVSGPAFAQPITVKLVNGKTGKPRTGVRVYIVLGDQKQQHLLDLRTDRAGEVRFDSGEEKTFQVRPVGEVSCGEQPIGVPVRDYLVGIVTSNGIVTRNDCGHDSPTAIPGQLTYLSRPATWWELFRN